MSPAISKQSEIASIIPPNGSRNQKKNTVFGRKKLQKVFGNRYQNIINLGPVIRKRHMVRDASTPNLIALENKEKDYY